MQMRLIDADELHKEIWSDNNGYLSRLESVAQILLRIESAPTIETHPVNIARWIVSSDGYYPYCPICGAQPDKKTRFCAECGAKLGE